jgi:ureidoglycolate lyase
MLRELHAVPLTAERFAPFGQVIEDARIAEAAMNDARFERFDDLCDIDTDGSTAISIARCRTPTSLPYRVDVVERHPLGSQAFIPLDGQAFVVVVAKPGAAPDAAALEAFVSNGRQGINYSRGTWHMPLIGLAGGQRFLVIDRKTADPNCDVHRLAEPVLLDRGR